MSKSLHPEIKQFKSFVRNNPHVLRDVKNESKTLQDLFEEWKLFGEEDDIWDSYLETSENEDSEEKSEEKNKSDSTKDIDVLNMLKKMNLNDLQHHLGQFTTVIGSVQELIGQFKQQQPSQTQTPPPPERPSSFFGFRED
ncbi:spore coat protein YlbD [Salipaludibacillus sp. CF4.18]|uniref:spore coat protein YlbD n=1 Tax=Salipaludibacillus sp. CF4.18 TaxID=3373081 RepID=UPI003EE60305